MPAFTNEFTLPDGNRMEKRQALISYFLNEVPGTGNGNLASRYRYNVEAYGNYRIYLKRPTQLNKGFDFTVNVEGMYFKKNRRYSNPSHQDIVNALISCMNEYPDEYPSVRVALGDIYHCNDLDLSHIHACFRDYNGTEHPIQIILLATKWLFMEQDCAYWNYSGRRMLFEEFSSHGLV